MNLNIIWFYLSFRFHLVTPPFLTMFQPYCFFSSSNIPDFPLPQRLCLYCLFFVWNTLFSIFIMASLSFLGLSLSYLSWGLLRHTQPSYNRSSLSPPLFSSYLSIYSSPNKLPFWRGGVGGLLPFFFFFFGPMRIGTILDLYISLYP